MYMNNDLSILKHLYMNIEFFIDSIYIVWFLYMQVHLISINILNNSSLIKIKYFAPIELYKFVCFLKLLPMYIFSINSKLHHKSKYIKQKAFYYLLFFSQSIVGFIFHILCIYWIEFVYFQKLLPMYTFPINRKLHHKRKYIKQKASPPALSFSKYN